MDTLLNTIPNLSERNLARTSLPFQEYQARIKRYTNRAEKRLPLFGKAGRPCKKEPRVKCCGCNIVPKKRSYLIRQGWKIEVIMKFNGKRIGCSISVSWCPKCQHMERKYHGNDDSRS